ncbi:hypothetical protein Tsubulata_019179 [Turnera subulata]|uniref:Reverse transcriptase zinc-binding domain-containing protein n=1 Tax=Turnera subulata TaxID=218843 RepID=A0A9Q0JNL2_9ROSI|nr:hypothetical protein Tsubulata_019179 [Turnera subulata]
MCPFCSTHLETINHLFLHCKLSWSLWQRLVSWWGAEWVVPGDITVWYYNWPFLSPSITNRSTWLLLGLSLLWTIWLARNNLVFTNVEPNHVQLFDVSLVRAFWWIKSLQPEFPYSAGCSFLAADALHSWRGVLRKFT